ncbi:unnamed protein product, partial [Heterosigma akashiwo]
SVRAPPLPLRRRPYDLGDRRGGLRGRGRRRGPWRRQGGEPVPPRVRGPRHVRLHRGPVLVLPR